MASLPSTSSSAPSLPSIPEPAQRTAGLDRQLVLRQVATICASVQPLAETLTAAYLPAVEPPQPSRTTPQPELLAVANQLHSLATSLRTLAEALLAASEPAVELLHNAEEEPIQLQPSSAADAEGETESRECSVCMDQKPIENFPKATESCGHELNACDQCIQLWLQAKIEDNLWSRLACMANGCDELLQHGDWQRLAPTELFEKYDSLLTKEVLAANPDFRHCLSPDCKSGQEHEPNPQRPVFTCNECGHQSCATHNIPWHEDETCEEYELRVNPAAQEAASLAEIARVTKLCPGTGDTPCGTPIIKNGGCPHMTCTQCGHEFCYFCLVNWGGFEEGETEHEADCEREERWRNNV